MHLREQHAKPNEANGDSTPKLPTYSSYKEYIDAYVSEWPEYQWLQHFLGKPGSQPSETKTTVLDSIDGSLIERAQFTSDITGLSDMLSSRSADVKTRLIIVSYPESWRIDRQVVDLLGWTFDIDPNFFRRHFYYYFVYIEALADKGAKDSIEREVSSLPSDQDPTTFELGFVRNYDKISSLLHRDPVSQQSTGILRLLPCLL